MRNTIMDWRVMSLVVLGVLLSVPAAHAQSGQLTNTSMTPIPFHVVYVQFFDHDVRKYNNNQALAITAETMQPQLQSIVGRFSSSHEILAILTAGASKHIHIYTEIPDVKVEVETFVFLFSHSDAVLLPHVSLLRPPPAISDEDEDVDESPVVSSVTNRRRHKAGGKQMLTDEL